MQQVDDPPSLSVGTEVSAKYKGAFCEAKVSKVVRNIKVKVAYKHGLGSGAVSDDAVKSGLLRVGSVVEVKHPDRKETVEATVTKIQDCSQYTVVFDDGDITTLRRTALCLKSGRHFNESETLDQLPLTHPEHFGNPVVGGRRGRRRHMNDDSSDDEDESDTKEVVNEKEEHIGKVVCVETESKKKDKEKWFPGLVVSPNAQATVRIRVKDEYLVRSFKDGRYYTVPKKEATEFTREAAAKQDGPAVQAALEYLDSDVLPAHWDRDALFGLSNSSSEEDAEIESDSSDDEPREEKDRFVAQLYKYMDDRGTPLNKVPSIQSRDVDLYRLFRAVQKRGGYNRVTTQNQWKSIAIRLGFTPVTVSVANLVKQAYKKFLQPYGEFHRKLGCSMLMTPRNSNRSKGRSLVRANSVASPKPVESVNRDSSSNTTSIGIVAKLASISTPHPSSGITSTAAVGASPTGAAVATSTLASTQPSAAAIQSATEESENTSESSVDTAKAKRKASMGSGKVKSLIEKYEEKTSLSMKDDGDVPLAKMKAAAAACARAEDKEVATSSIGVAKEGAAVQTQTATTRENSPTGVSPGAVKKEKYQRKLTPQSEEKRGKRKKDEISVEKVDIGDFVVEIGDKLKVYYHEKKVTYEAKVIEITLQRGVPMYLVHYTGWNNRYDEWVPRERIAENLTKGSKQKGRGAANTGNVPHDRSKENPPKPPILTQTSTNAMASSMTTSIILSSTSTSAKTPTPTSVRRGRGRSDSLPPRSTTPSSVASNSSRTKSPAASSASLKKRPARSSHPSSTHRRTSTNVSDVSIPTETDTDSDDEPVRRPTRTAKDALYKGSAGTVSKVAGKHKASASVTNSQTDESDDDDEDEDEALNPSSCRAITSTAMSAKGRDYDLNQIRSELKGFQEIKSPSPGADDSTPANKGGNKAKEEVLKLESKEETLKTEAKEEPIKSSTTDISSETDSFADDDSQSSDKTTTLENMTKKFQQKINADKQRALVKVPASGKVVPDKLSNLSTKTHIVEKIIKDSLAEKRQESLKAKPAALTIKDESKLIKIELDLPSSSPNKATTTHAEVARLAMSSKEEEKKPPSSLIATETKTSTLIAPARFGTGLAGSKFTSVIVDKPLNVSNSKKGDPPSAHLKKHDTPKKLLLTEGTSRKAMEQSSAALSKEQIIKIEPPAACSPTSSSSSSSSSSSTSATSASSRSLPDMSKLDISGSSSTCSSTHAQKDTKTSGAAILKPNSPDIYEFKDPEPFEYEMRKSTLTPHSAGAGAGCMMSAATTTSSTIPSIFDSKRKMASQKMAASIETAPIINPLTAIVNRKKRGSPMKDAIVEKSKQLKIEEKQPLVLEAKLMLRGSAASHSLPSGSAVSAIKLSTVGQSKTLSLLHSSVSSATNASLSSGSSVKTVAALHPTAQKGVHEHFDKLRKSPSFNLNINALNEELAQTVQETTRALTDALHTVPPAEQLTPVKAVTLPSTSAAKANIYGTTPHHGIQVSPKMSTPPASAPSVALTTKVVVGSPFIETRKDLSNVFELSTAENDTSGSTSGSGKDNKFELENVKILLSHSASAFDLEPGKFENKPTSIADKVLKAISQKKEVESKNKEVKQMDLDSKDAVVPAAISGCKASSETITALSLTSGSTVKSMSTLVTTSLTSAPLQIGPDHLPTPSGPCNDLLLTNAGRENASEKCSHMAVLPAATQLAKRPILGSPDAKLSMLESISVKNNDLSETIQKLECALQKKTPVTSTGGCSLPAMASTASSSTTAAAALTSTSAFSDDSMDSTDSERRLVIEDVDEQPYGGEYQKSPPPPSTTTHTQIEDSKSAAVPQLSLPHATASVKVDAPPIAPAADSSVPTTPPITIAAIVPNIQAPAAIPVKVLAPAGKPHTTSTTMIASKFVGKLHGNTSAVILTTISATPIQQHSLIPLKQIPQQSQQTVTLPPHAMRLATAATMKTNEVTVAASGTTKLTEHNQEATVATSVKAVPSQIAQRTAATVVPIVLPDIPVSVVVASSAVPSVVAAAQAAAAAAAAQQIPTQTKQQQAITAKTTSSPSSSAAITTTTMSTINPQVATSSFSANSASLKTFENAAAVRNVQIKPIAIVGPSPPPASGAMILNHNSGNNTNSVVFTQPTTVASSSVFFLDARNTGLRPDDGVRPISDTPTDDDADEKSNKTDAEDNNSNTTNSAIGGGGGIGTGTSLVDTHNDSINLLLCEETIPGSPAPAFGKESPQLSNRNSTHADDKVLEMEEILGKDGMPAASTAKAAKSSAGGGSLSLVNPTASSSPNDSASQDEMSSEELKKHIDLENEISPRKRRRTRKQSEMLAQISEQQTKRRRPLLACSKKNNAGSDSDDNSDAISQRSTTSARPHQQQQQQQHQQQQQLQQQMTTAGGRSCPYNFLVQLDPAMNPDQRIALLLKQIQDLRKTYNMIKGDLASIDRRRKKLRRREREKKQQIQQQQVKVSM